MRLWPSTSENSQITCSAPGSSVNTVRKCAKSTCAWRPGRGLEADLERGRLGGPDIAQEVGENGVAAGVAEIAQLAMQSATGQLRKGGDPLAQIALEPQ